jgi:hypothetical protein
MRTISVDSYNAITPCPKTRTGEDIVTCKSLWLVIDPVDQRNEALLAAVDKSLSKCSLIQRIGGQIAMVQSRDVERKPKPLLMIFIQTFTDASPLGITTITEAILKAASVNNTNVGLPEGNYEARSGDANAATSGYAVGARAV